MLSELTSMQGSDESVDHVELSIDVETRDSRDGEVLSKVYTFEHSKEWDKWVFVEFEEYTASAEAGKRNWSKSRHIMWYDESEPDIAVPQEVSSKLSEILGADEVTIRGP
jgi:hypothetical protein